MTLQSSARNVFVSFALLALLIWGVVGCATFFDSSRSFDTVVIDAGHGGHDRGAHPRGAPAEKVVALDTAQRLERHLRAAGFRTVMTRTGDYFVPLGQRVRIAQRHRNAIFVSVHYNYARNRRARGAETYYHNRNSIRLAENIQRSLLTIPGKRDRGVMQANFYVLRNNRLPAVLVEGGFLTNAQEASQIRDPAYREQVAIKIAEGIVRQRYGPRATLARAKRRAAAEEDG